MTHPFRVTPAGDLECATLDDAIEAMNRIKGASAPAEEPEAEEEPEPEAEAEPDVEPFPEPAPRARRKLVAKAPSRRRPEREPAAPVSDARRLILDLLESKRGRPFTTAEVHEVKGGNLDATRVLLSSMHRAGQIHRTSPGSYASGPGSEGD